MDRLLLNREGNLANDFTFITNKLNAATLYSIDAPYTLIFFNSIGCDICRGFKEEIMKVSGIVNMIDNKQLAVLALYTENDINGWIDNAKNYPKSWIYAHDNNFSISTTGLYYINATPSLYLLDREKRVILKDADLSVLLRYFDENILKK